MKNSSFLAFIFLLSTICIVNFSCSKENGGTPTPGTVSILDNSFSPSTITVDKGVTVTWTNNGASDHTVTSEVGAELASPDIASGGTYAHLFNTAGTFDYYCTIHGLSMSGTVIVNP